LDVPPPTPINRTQNNTMPLTSAGLWWRVVAHFKLTRYHSQFARPTAGCTHTWSPQGGNAGNMGRGEGGGEDKVSVTWHSHTQTRTGPHNAPPHSHHFPQRTQPPHMQSRTGDGSHRRQRREQGSAAQWTCTRRQPPAQANRPHIPTQHRTTPCRSPAGAPGGAWSPASS
jgi:hypothetical protein